MVLESIVAYQFQFRAYQRPFRKALKTTYGLWRNRQGILVHLTDDDGRFGLGEIAPLEWFGTERLQEATLFCQGLEGQIDDATIDNLALPLPCCRFAFESARAMLEQKRSHRPGHLLPVAALLSAGEKALPDLFHWLEKGYTTFKWKIGVGDLEKEQETFARLSLQLPRNGRIRLDGNGALTRSEAMQWLQFLDPHKRTVEFLEQPLLPQEVKSMHELAQGFTTPIALDESVAGLDRIKKVVSEGWRGPLIVKPAILGSPAAFLKWRPQCPCPLVFSSVFETAIGLQAGLQLAAISSTPGWAVGFGTHLFFPDDGLSPYRTEPFLNPDQFTLSDLSDLWDQIGKN